MRYQLRQSSVLILESFVIIARMTEFVKHFSQVSHKKCGHAPDVTAGAQLSICFPRKFATVCASLNSTSEAGGEFFSVMNSTQPITSPSEMTGAATEMQYFSSAVLTGVLLPPVLCR